MSAISLRLRVPEVRIKMEIGTVCRSQVDSHTHEDYSQAAEKNNSVGNVNFVMPVMKLLVQPKEIMLQANNS